MELSLVAFLFGAILLAVAILGGGFELKELKVPKVSWFPRFISSFLGMFFVVLGIGLETSMKPPSPPPPTVSSPTQQSPSTDIEKEEDLLKQLDQERQSRENAEQELQRLKSESSSNEQPPKSLPQPPLSSLPSSFSVDSDQSDTLPFFMVRAVSEADLRGKNMWELDIMRNEIFARYGRRFQRADLQNYFNGQPWYTPKYLPDKFPTSLLTPMQRENAKFILEYQN